LTAFSAAYRFDVEHCPRCGAKLPRPRSAIERARAPRGLSHEGRAGEATTPGMTSGR
jgi:hypothetical protein